MAKANQPRYSIYSVLIILSICIWVCLFKHFLDASLPLQGDAPPYFRHIRFYLENMATGVYPLWDPSRENGNLNQFFLRRIGEFNPFFWLILVLNKIGFSFTVSYRIFFSGYYLSGINAFYLLSLRLFKDQRVAWTAGLILLFSSLGAQVFESFILLEIVPILWFSYFLTAFFQTPNRFFFLGTLFSLMIINITYLPFYFYTVFMVFIMCFIAFYFSFIREIYQKIRIFVSRNPALVALGSGLWVFSLVPGWLWYRTSSQGETFSAIRHAGATDTNFSTVAIDRVNEGGILAYLLLDRQFVHLNTVRLSDFYVPFFIFLIVAMMIRERLNRRLILLFTFGFVIFLIGLTDASGIYAFLYAHVPFFKYFRNLQFFLWMAVLPALILFAMEGMRIFIKECEEFSLNRRWMSVWAAGVHVCAAAICMYLGTTALSTYIVIVLSFVWTLSQIWRMGNPQLWLGVLFAAIIIQPVEVYSRLTQAYSPEKEDTYELDYRSPLPSSQSAKAILNKDVTGVKGTSHVNDIYFSTRWFYEALTRLNYDVLKHYREAPFIAYDAVEPAGNDVNFKRMERSMGTFENLAFVHSDSVSLTDHSPGKARILTLDDKDFEFNKLDANNVVVTTSFERPKFLVRTANYHHKWRVFVDDRETQLYRVNIFAQGLWVPAGKHVVHWSFRDPLRYALGYILFVVYWIILGWVLWSGWLYRKSMSS